MLNPTNSDATGAGTPMASTPINWTDQKGNTSMTSIDPFDQADAEWSAVPVDSDGIAEGAGIAEDDLAALVEATIPAGWKRIGPRDPFGLQCSGVDGDVDCTATPVIKTEVHHAGQGPMTLTACPDHIAYVVEAAAATVPDAEVIDLDGDTYQVVDTRSATPVDLDGGELDDAHRLHDVLIGCFARILEHCDILNAAAQRDLSTAADWNRAAITRPAFAARRDEHCARAAQLIDWSTTLGGIVADALAAADLDGEGGAR